MQGVSVHTHMKNQNAMYRVLIFVPVRDKDCNKTRCCFQVIYIRNPKGFQKLSPSIFPSRNNFHYGLFKA